MATKTGTTLGKAKGAVARRSDSAGKTKPSKALKDKYGQSQVGNQSFQRRHVTGTKLNDDQSMTVFLFGMTSLQFTGTDIPYVREALRMTKPGGKPTKQDKYGQIQIGDQSFQRRHVVGTKMNNNQSLTVFLRGSASLQFIGLDIPHVRAALHMSPLS